MNNDESIDEEKSVYEETVEKLNGFFLPKTNSTYERHILRQMKQKDDEKIEVFVLRLRSQAERCGFGDQLNDNIKDQIIEKCTSAALRKELLKKGDAELEEILRVAKAFEAVNEQEKMFNADKSASTSNEVNKVDFEKPKSKIECTRCGLNGHKGTDEKCPAKGKICHLCGKHDHFSRKCLTRKRKQSGDNSFGRNKDRKRFGKEDTVKQEDGRANKSNKDKIKSGDVNKIDAKTNETKYVFCIGTSQSTNEMKCNIGGIDTTAIVDSGSKYNVMDEQSWNQLKAKKIIVQNQRTETNVRFKAYGDNELPVLGVFETDLAIGIRSRPVEFFVMKGKGKLLIGQDTAIAMGILKIGIDVNEISDFPNNAKIGKMKNVVVDIPIKSDARPVIQPYRRFPIALEEKVEKQIKNLLEQGIVEPVNGPSKWISPMVVVPKGDDVRICLNMRCANAAVEREHYPLPTFEDFLPQLGQSNLFSRIDIRQAFHQVEISEESRHITTFFNQQRFV